MTRIGRLRKSLAPLAAGCLSAALRASVVPRPIRKRLWHIAEAYVSFYGVRAVRRCRTGARLLVDTSKMVEKQIYFFGEWEPSFSRLLADLAPSQGIFLDVGANIGYFSLLAASRFDGVVAIEASPRTHAALLANLARNPQFEVRTYNVAVGPETGVADFYYDPVQSGGSSLSPGSGREFEARVPVCPLFDIVPQEVAVDIAMIKVDVEGHEHIVLRQILDHLPRLRHDLRIMVEYVPERSPDLREIFYAYLSAGFSARLLQGPYSIDEYLDRNTRGHLVPLDAPPDIFCDVLFERGAASEAGTRSCGSPH